MRKVIGAINMTVDGFCDHTVILPDEEIHQHYEKLLLEAGVILYGRITYRLMEYWKEFIEHPSGEKSMDDFALAIDNIPKIIFSNSLKNTGWASAIRSDLPLVQTVTELKQQKGKDILVGSRSLIIQLMQLHLIDELQLCIHPVIASKGLPLFENIHEKMLFKRTKTKNFDSGAVILYFEPVLAS
ncbi:MAG: dihydrofolate reductase family protein [Sphingobacterium sp.]|jgi:dihydrofolate reductase|nr:dihydrofolate reductase family protein [Sphingobacterium sp.]